MNARGWLDNAQQELAELGRESELTKEDAWRTLVLFARLAVSPFGHVADLSVYRRLGALQQQCQPIPAQAVLDVLAAELASTSEPAGPLHDALLDVDDTIGVLHVAGASGKAQELAAHGAGLVALWPERVPDLLEFAEMRLDAMVSTAPGAALWRAVRHAPAHLLVAGMHVPRPELLRPAAVRRPARVYALPDRVLREAASTSERWEDRLSPEADVWLSQRDGKYWMEVRDASRVKLELVRRDNGVVVAGRVLTPSVEGNTGYLDLGPVAGSDSLFHQLLRESGLDADAVARRVVLDDE
jgi:hypothetical protein